MITKTSRDRAAFSASETTNSAYCWMAWSVVSTDLDLVRTWRSSWLTPVILIFSRVSGRSSKMSPEAMPNVATGRIGVPV